VSWQWLAGKIFSMVFKMTREIGEEEVNELVKTLN